MIDIGPVMSAVIGGLIAILGWPVAHWLTRKREIHAEKRQLRVTYLLEAYRRLEDAGNRRITPRSDQCRNIESAIADIQLLGTPTQIRLAADFAEDFARDGTASFDLILYDLRASLRRELELETTSAPLKFIWIS